MFECSKFSLYKDYLFVDNEKEDFINQEEDIMIPWDELIKPNDFPSFNNETRGESKENLSKIYLRVKRNIEDEVDKIITVKPFVQSP